jgi:hypothetical protein
LSITNPRFLEDRCGVAFRTSNTVLCGTCSLWIGSTVRFGAVCAATVAAYAAVKATLMVVPTALRFIAFLLVSY